MMCIYLVALGSLASVCASAADSDLSNLLDAADKNVSATAHRRRRRYVVFPEGSTFTVAFCLSVQALTAGTQSIFSEGINWALSYDLPNETRHEKKEELAALRRQEITRPFHTQYPNVPFVLTQNPNLSPVRRRPSPSFPFIKPLPYTQPTRQLPPLHRHKRQLYQKAEILLNSAGFDGRTCILRAICETAQLIPPRQGVIHEIIRIIFTYPPGSSSKGGKFADYALAHSEGETDNNCVDNYPCPISLLDVLLRFGIKDSAVL